MSPCALSRARLAVFCIFIKTYNAFFGTKTRYQTIQSAEGCTMAYILLVRCEWALSFWNGVVSSNGTDWYAFFESRIVRNKGINNLFKYTIFINCPDRFVVEFQAWDWSIIVILNQRIRLVYRICTNHGCVGPLPYCTLEIYTFKSCVQWKGFKIEFMCFRRNVFRECRWCRYW